MDTTELACARCDYDLRMLDRAGVCPECALPIGASVAAAADPIGPGRRGLHRAALVLLLAAAVHATTAAGAAGALAIEGLDHSIPTTIALVLDPWPLDVFFAVMRILRRVNDGWFTARLALVVAFVLQLAGIWLVTSAPSVRGGNRALRLTARWSAVVSVAPYVMAVLAIVFNVPFVGSLLGPTTAFVATVVPPVALAWWASHLLRRIRPSRPLLRWAAWSVIIASGAAAAFNERDYGPGHSLEWAGVGVTCVAFVAMTWIWWRLRRATRPRRGADRRAGGGYNAVMPDRVICELCGTVMPAGASYVVKIDVYADPSVPAMSTEELEETDFDHTFAKLIEEMKHLSADDLQDDVHRRFEYRICRPCQRRFLANPLGKPRETREGAN